MLLQTLKSPSQETDPIHKERELIGHHVTLDMGVEGIDKFGTNTFQNYTWMATPAVPYDSSSKLNAPTDQQTMQKSAPLPTPLVIANPGSPATLQAQFHGDNGMETDTKFGNPAGKEANAKGEGNSSAGRCRNDRCGGGTGRRHEGQRDGDHQPQQ